MSSSSVNVRFVSSEPPSGHQQKGGGGGPVAIHVGALRLENEEHVVTTAAVIGIEVSAVSGASETTTGETTEAGNSTAAESRSTLGQGQPKPSWEMLLLMLFSGNGCNLLLAAIVVAIFFSVPLAMIVVGALYMGLESCYDESIAILLILGGIFSLLFILTRATHKVTDSKRKARARRQEQNRLYGEYLRVEGQIQSQGDLGLRPHQNRRPKEDYEGVTWMSVMHGVVAIVDTVWLVVFSVFVYQAFEKVDLESEESEFYCEKTLYMFSFCYLTITWTLLGIWILYCLIACFVTRCVCYCSRREA